VRVRHHGDQIFKVLDSRPHQTTKLTVDRLENAVAREVIEHNPPPSNLPETIPVSEIAREALRRWFTTLSCADGNAFEAAGLRAINKANKTLWQGGTQ
jgi:hypothetical protein